MKRCPKCGIEKDESEFYRDKITKDGLSCWCKLCIKKTSIQRYHKKYGQKDGMNITNLETLKFLQEYQDENGIMPTSREVKDNFHITKQAVSLRVHKLNKKGYDIKLRRSKRMNEKVEDKKQNR